LTRLVPRTCNNEQELRAGSFNVQPAKPPDVSGKHELPILNLAGFKNLPGLILQLMFQEDS